MAITAAAGGGSWTTGATWVGGVAPTAADDAVLDGTSGNVTLTSSTSPLCRSLNCTGYTGTLNHQGTCTATIGDGTRGDFKFSAGMTYTRGSASTSIFAFASTASGNLITTAGKTLATFSFSGSGAWTLQDAFTSAGQVLHTAGTLDWGTGLTHAPNQLTCTGATTRVMNLNDCVLNIPAPFNGALELVATGLTFNPGTSQINLTANVTGASILKGGGMTYYDLAMTGTGVQGITGNNTFHNFTRGNAVACGLTLPNGGTQTITGTLQMSGSAGQLVTITSVTGGTASSISKASGTVSCDYMSLKDSTATGGAAFYAGANSTDVSGNTGWTFTAPPAGGNAQAGRLGLCGVGA